jgi:hypothetical protein
MTESVRWICPTCNVTVTTPFCGHCGEEPLAPRDLTLHGLGEKLLHALTSVDARAMRSAGKLLCHPGELTLAWTKGVRKLYVAPFQLFLIANVLFFGVQWLTSENVFSSSRLTSSPPGLERSGSRVVGAATGSDAQGFRAI